MTNILWIALAGGAAAFGHCLGMCGPFALHLSQGQGKGRVLANQLTWHLGRITSYVFLGALAGLAGGALTTAHWPWIQNLLAYLAGGTMILMGLVLLGVKPWNTNNVPPQTSCAPANEGLVASLFRQFFNNPTPAGALGLGLANGFLPCPIVLAFLALSMQQGSVLTGMGVMAAMGIGTTWSLLTLGLAGQAVRGRMRRGGAILGACIVIIMGLATALRGTEAFHHLLRCPQAQAMAAQPSNSPSDANAAPPCCHKQSQEQDRNCPMQH